MEIPKKEVPKSTIEEPCGISLNPFPFDLVVLLTLFCGGISGKGLFHAKS